MDCSDHNEVSVVIDNGDSEEDDSEQAENNVHYTPRRKMFYHPYQNRFITQLYSINLSVY